MQKPIRAMHGTPTHPLTLRLDCQPQRHESLRCLPNAPETSEEDADDKMVDEKDAGKAHLETLLNRSHRQVPCNTQKPGQIEGTDTTLSHVPCGTVPSVSSTASHREPLQSEAATILIQRHWTKLQTFQITLSGGCRFAAQWLRRRLVVVAVLLLCSLDSTSGQIFEHRLIRSVWHIALGLWESQPPAAILSCVVVSQVLAQISVNTLLLIILAVMVVDWELIENANADCLRSANGHVPHSIGEKPSGDFGDGSSESLDDCLPSGLVGSVPEYGVNCCFSYATGGCYMVSSSRVAEEPVAVFDADLHMRGCDSLFQVKVLIDSGSSWTFIARKALLEIRAELNVSLDESLSKGMPGDVWVAGRTIRVTGRVTNLLLHVEGADYVLENIYVYEGDSVAGVNILLGTDNMRDAQQLKQDLPRLLIPAA